MRIIVKREETGFCDKGTTDAGEGIATETTIAENFKGF